MAIPLALMAGVSAIPSLIKGISGIRQTAAAKKAERNLKRPKLEIPKYEIPNQVTDVTKNVKMAALDTKLPGADIMKSEVDAETANAIQAARQAGASSADVLSTIASMGGQASKAKRAINLEGAKRYDEMQSDVNRALMTEAGYEDKKQAADQQKYINEFEYNQDQPYKSEAATISALRQSGNENIYGAANDLASLGTSLMMSNALMNNAGAAARTVPPANGIVLRDKPLGPPTFDQFMQQPVTRMQPLGPPSYNDWLMQNGPVSTSGFGSGRLTNQTVSAQQAQYPTVTQQQSMMGQYGQSNTPYNYITGVPSPSLAPVKPSWYYQQGFYNGIPYQSQGGPREK